MGTRGEERRMSKRKRREGGEKKGEESGISIYMWTERARRSRKYESK
jgi:hypothetical protein